MIHHVEIYVTDLGASKEFWHWLLCDWLGYHVHQEWKNGVSFKQAQTYLVFVQADSVHTSAGYHRRRVGLNHLAFHAPSQDFIDRLAKEIDSRKISKLYESPMKDGNNYSLFFEDPDRIKIEITLDGQQD